MDKRIKALWLDALRSGEYEQTKGVLTRVNRDGEKSYCCLGVLCDVAVKDGFLDIETTTKAMGHVDYIAYNNFDTILPPSVQEWAGLFTETGGLPGRIVDDEDDTYGTLTELNDHAEYDFNQIADVIEQQF